MWKTKSLRLIYRAQWWIWIYVENKTSSSRYSYGIGSNGHGAKVLIADGNFPLSTCTPAHCKKSFFEFITRCSIRNGGFKSDQGVYPCWVRYDNDSSGWEWTIYTHRIRENPGQDIILKREKRSDFNHAVKSEDTCLAIATRRNQAFANILLVIGSNKNDLNWKWSW